MKDSITVVATTTLVTLRLLPLVTNRLLCSFLWQDRARFRTSVRSIGFDQRVPNHRFPLLRMELRFEPPQRDADHIPVAELGAFRSLVHLEPQIMDQIDILGPKLRRLRAQV